MVKYKIMTITILSSFFFSLLQTYMTLLSSVKYKKKNLGFFCPYTELELMLFINKKSSTEETKHM